eukprot:scaffold12395_cov431-Chaetoceros_neogracile.AAC.1
MTTNLSQYLLKAFYDVRMHGSRTWAVNDLCNAPDSGSFFRDAANSTMGFINFCASAAQEL